MSEVNSHPEPPITLVFYLRSGAIVEIPAMGFTYEQVDVVKHDADDNHYTETVPKLSWTPVEDWHTNLVEIDFASVEVFLIRRSAEQIEIDRNTAPTDEVISMMGVSHRVDK